MLVDMADVTRAGDVAPWQRVRRRTGAGVALIAVALGLAVTGCGGSSTSASITVPATAGLSVDRAVTVLCNSGLRIGLGESITTNSSRPGSRSAPTTAGKSVVNSIHAAGTIPRAGTVVARGSTVTFLEAGPPGVGEIVAVASSCRAGAPAERGLIHAVATSRQGASLAPSFPASPASVSCVIIGGGPAPGIRVPGTCASIVLPTGGSGGTVQFLETWRATEFSGPGSPRTGRLWHVWRFALSPKGQVLSVQSSGAFPPQSAR